MRLRGYWGSDASETELAAQLVREDEASVAQDREHTIGHFGSGGDGILLSGCLGVSIDGVKLVNRGDNGGMALFPSKQVGFSRHFSQVHKSWSNTGVPLRRLVESLLILKKAGGLKSVHARSNCACSTLVPVNLAVE
ncbi:MAG TPA: hypothetical protein VE201_01290 [Nitrospirales bacterium]|nr:hypothetical protein [Nitrospirales bacterium]